MKKAYIQPDTHTLRLSAANMLALSLGEGEGKGPDLSRRHDPVDDADDDLLGSATAAGRSVWD